jgi:preprotein translocase subunit SecG
MGRRPSYLPSEDSTNLDRRDLNSNLNNDEDSHSSVQLMGLDLARQNSKKACIRRSFVIALLVIVAVLVTVFLQQSSNNREEDIFETEFDVLSLKLTENFLSVFEIKIWTSFSVSVSITSDALYYNRSTSWPNVLVPNFDLRMKATHQTQTTQQQQQQQQQSNTILFAPLVADNNRVSWESFVVQNQDQVAVKPNDDRTLADGIYMPGPDGTRIRDPGPGPYFPAFLISTSNPKDNARHILTNYYGVPTFRRIYDTLIKTEASVISEISQTDDDVPLSVLFTPVFDRTESPKSVVGVIQQDVDWRSHFQAVTPNQGSVIAVLETGAGEILSFEISEDSVKYLGQGDRHDSKYDDYLVTSEVSTGSLRDSTKDTIWNQDAYSSGIIALAIPASQDEAVSPESLDYTTGTFSYILSVYPTQCFEDAYKTNLPMIYTVVAAVVFALIIILFIIHDKLFERRQQRPMEPAVRFGKVVNSLFPPGGLQTRLFPKEAKEERIQERAVVVRWPSFRRLMSNDDSLRVMEPAKTRLRSFLNHSEQKDLAELEQYQYEDPIADLFPETTIMFADISGFTAWSSEREPSQVFYLLETLYRAFDQLASRLGVFKVDTIGDCYVAVTGLPDPNKVSFCTLT